jgi:preprotein translocase subunit SecG
MEHVVLVIHLILTVALIVLILLQRSEGGGLGIGGGGGGGLGSFASAQSTANALTKATTFVAICFFTTSMVLGMMASRGGGQPASILDSVDSPPAASSSASPEGETGAKPEPVQDSKAPATDTTKEEDKTKSAPVVPLAE